MGVPDLDLTLSSLREDDRGTLRRVTHPHELLPAYAWRASIGFLQPGGANPHHLHEFYMMVPDGVSTNLISLRSIDDQPTEFLSLRRQIAEFADIPFVVDVRPCIEAMHSLDMARVLVIAPFTHRANQEVAEYVSPDGIQVSAMHRIDQAEHGSLHRLPLGSV